MQSNTSWEPVSSWYNKTVGEAGSYYHKNVILPNTLRLLDLKNNSKLLDIACGQGVLARVIPKEVEYLGIDVSKTLIEAARKIDLNTNHLYGIADVEKDLPITPASYSHATIILALQNFKHPFKVIKNIEKHLIKGGKLVIVLNHPSFRIPKHSDWTVDKENQVQYRKEEIYMTPQQIPIESSPFDKVGNQATWSFHYPLSAYSEMLFDNNFVIEKIEEWVSDKKSEGGAAKMEDKARKEFPLFMTLVACRK